MKLLFLTIVLGAGALVSCADQAVKTEPAAAVEAHETPELKLNNGARWIINDEMKEPLNKAELALGEYQACEVKEPKELAETLEKYNQSLISSCTMQGPGHDELHKWLMPHLELVKDLKKAANEQEAEETIVGLEESFTVFHNYFE